MAVERITITDVDVQAQNGATIEERITRYLMANRLVAGSTNRKARKQWRFASDGGSRVEGSPLRDWEVIVSS